MTEVKINIKSPEQLKLVLESQGMESEESWLEALWVWMILSGQDWLIEKLKESWKTRYKEPF